MELTKHTHACVSLRKGHAHLLIDPGTFTPDALELLDEADAVLITHEHFDHFDEALIAAAIETIQCFLHIFNCKDCTVGMLRWTHGGVEGFVDRRSAGGQPPSQKCW